MEGMDEEKEKVNIGDTAEDTLEDEQGNEGAPFMHSRGDPQEKSLR